MMHDSPSLLDEYAQVTQTALAMYLEQLKADGYSRSHRARVKAVVSGFARWLIEEKGSSSHQHSCLV
jgi:site-specific recombinase XerD